MPDCECGKHDPKWSPWSGSEVNCSNGPDERTRKRKCEKNHCPWNPLFPCCPKIHKKHYYQVEFEPCRKLG